MTEPLTDEERDYLNTPDEVIRKRHKSFSFDEEKFNERVSKGEPWQQLIQAHLYLDHTISLMLQEGLAKPKAIDANRMGFHQKLGSGPIKLLAQLRGS
jgi:hypothetical protein